ncbi:tetratricopeptide repeat protein 36 isoform X2 [Cavia porcellus]|uniref:tetratricopeptide repeat protein 36 isoform X2 n=1 Tax=Cavia porcellus TaxID=10141 RepID=UPI002FE3888C
MGTPNDQAVLQAIFNPNTPFGDILGVDLGEETEQDRDEDAVFPPARLEQCKALELQGVRAAEAGDLSTALERFGQAIALLPERASAYNNRAQARRLQGDVAGHEHKNLLNMPASAVLHLQFSQENIRQRWGRSLQPFRLQTVGRNWRAARDRRKMWEQVQKLKLKHLKCSFRIRVFDFSLQYGVLKFL